MANRHLRRSHLFALPRRVETPNPDSDKLKRGLFWEIGALLRRYFGECLPRLLTSEYVRLFCPTAALGGLVAAIVLRFAGVRSRNGLPAPAVICEIFPLPNNLQRPSPIPTAPYFHRWYLSAPQLAQWAIALSKLRDPRFPPNCLKLTNLIVRRQTFLLPDTRLLSPET